MKQRLIHLSKQGSLVNTAIERQILTIEESFQIIDVCYRILENKSERGLLFGYNASMKNIDQSHYLRKQEFGESTEADNSSNSEILNSIRILLRLATETIGHPPEPTPVLLAKIDEKVMTPEFYRKYVLLKLDSFRIFTKLGDPKNERLNRSWSNVKVNSYKWRDSLVTEREMTTHNEKMQDHYTSADMGKKICAGLRKVMNEVEYRKMLGKVKFEMLSTKSDRMNRLKIAKIDIGSDEMLVKKGVSDVAKGSNGFEVLMESMEEGMLKPLVDIPEKLKFMKSLRFD